MKSLTIHTSNLTQFMKRLCLSPLVLSGLFLVIFIVSCGKQGGTGPAGATGATGPAGPAGPAGPKGDSASGSVIYSDWMDVNFLPDTVHTAGKIDTIGYYAIISVPKLTTAMLSNSDVKVYINTSDITNPLIYPLPYSGTSGLNIELSAYAQNIQLYSNGQVSTVTSNGKKIQQYRYMIVPGNTKASTGSNVKWSDYTAVKAFLGLND
ncbi:hypothetical protein ACQ86N_00125 [Puia sp. P3]|uniref:hypothetical protein n=1 Tax=Puia sp. P3 TaxID=3423952 RepID=UPI003D668FCE